MRIGKITLNEKEYLLCFSLYAVKECTERYGGMDNLFPAINGKDDVKNMEEAVWLLSLMMECGKRYAAVEGLEATEPLSEADIFAVADIMDFAKIKHSIVSTISAGGEREIQTEEKKGKKPKKEIGSKG